MPEPAIRAEQRDFLNALIDAAGDLSTLVELAQGCGSVEVARQLALAITSTFAIAWSIERIGHDLLDSAEPMLGELMAFTVHHRLTSPARLLAYVFAKPSYDA